MAPKTGLGRGLDSLIPGNDFVAGPSVPQAEPQSAVFEIPVDDIRANPHQPRMIFDKAGLEELAASIREHGVIQPLIVVKSKTPGAKPYTLIAGERRWQASRLAGLAQVPAMIKDYAPQQMLEVALIENIQRRDLSALEEASAYQNLINEFGLTQQNVADRVGKSREDVGNTVRLLKLPGMVQQGLMKGEISEGHARALLRDGVTLEQQVMLFDEIKRSRLSVRQIEELVRRLIAGIPAARKSAEKTVDADLRSAESNLRNALGTKVSLQRSRKGGRIVIEYYSDEEFETIYGRIVGNT